MVEWLHNFLGTYSPPSYIVTEIIDGVEVASEVIPSGMAGVDWGYIFSAVLLCIVVLSFFKIIGGMICRIS